MGRVIRFLGVLPLLFVSSNAPQPLEIADADAIANWPAPAFWTPPAVRAPRGARTDAVSPALPPLPFIALNPCRAADTRGNGFTGAFGPPPLVANATRTFTIAGQCGVPSAAAAVSFNFTALNVSQAGDLRVFPAGGAVPTASTLNYNANTPNIANAAVVPLGTAGAITVQDNTVVRVRASDGKLLDTWTGANGAFAVLSAIGRVFVTGDLGVSPGKLYQIDPTLPSGAVTTLASNLGNTPSGIAFDGAKIW